MNTKDKNKIGFNHVFENKNFIRKKMSGYCCKKILDFWNKVFLKEQNNPNGIKLGTNSKQQNILQIRTFFTSRFIPIQDI